MDTKQKHAHESHPSRFGPFPLFSLFGFKVKLDVSWLLLCLLITWTLAAGILPSSYPQLPTATYWWMGLAGAIGVLLSIVIHELSHSLVARYYGLPIGGITLFIFGGVAEMEQEPDNPKTEFLMAVAGPLASVILGVVFFLLERLMITTHISTAVIGVSHYLAITNVVLAVFNLVPAFPLDGGRMLRAVIWHRKNNIKSATHVASRIGSGFGVVLMVLGILAFVQGNFIGGMWWFLIGSFLRSAAGSSYNQLLALESLSGRAVSQFMQHHPVTVSPSLHINDLVKDYVNQYYFKMFPVVENGRLLGCISMDKIKEVPKHLWEEKTVRDYIDGISTFNSVSPDADTGQLMSEMLKPGASTRFMIVEDGELMGVVSLKDMRNLLAKKLEIVTK